MRSASYSPRPCAIQAGTDPWSARRKAGFILLASASLWAVIIAGISAL